MNTNQDYTALALTPMYRLYKNKAAAEELYRILSGKTCDEVVCIKVRERCRGESSYYNFDMLVKLRNRTAHSLTIRFLPKLEDLDKFWEHPLGDLFEFENDAGDLCYCRPQTRLLVYFLLSDEQPGGKVICRVGFPTGEDDLEGYRAEMPTMIISTTGEGDGSEISRLARYLRHPEPGNPQFGPIGQVVECWIKEDSNAAEGNDNNGQS